MNTLSFIYPFISWELSGVFILSGYVNNVDLCADIYISWVYSRGRTTGSHGSVLLSEKWPMCLPGLSTVHKSIHKMPGFISLHRHQHLPLLSFPVYGKRQLCGFVLHLHNDYDVEPFSCTYWLYIFLGECQPKLFSDFFPIELIINRVIEQGSSLYI